MKCMDSTYPFDSECAFLLVLHPSSQDLLISLQSLVKATSCTSSCGSKLTRFTSFRSASVHPRAVHLERDRPISLISVEDVTLGDVTSKLTTSLFFDMVADGVAPDCERADLRVFKSLLRRDGIQVHHVQRDLHQHPFHR